MIDTLASGHVRTRRIVPTELSSISVAEPNHDHQYRGLQFDAHFASVFIALGEAGQLDHVMSHSDDGIALRTCPMCGPTLVIAQGSAADLEPESDNALIARAIQAAVQALPVEDMVRASAMPLGSGR